jgi:ATP-dependent Clp protease protease subunit
VILGTAVNDVVASSIMAQLLFLESEDPEKDINFYINSPGGVVSAGLAIYDTMQHIKCDVATTCMGMAASMGAVLLTAGTEGKRSCLPHARVMIHQPLGGVQGQASDIEIEAQEILRIKKELSQILADHSGHTIDEIIKASDRNNWMTANEAKDYGLIDNVLDKRKADK